MADLKTTIAQTENLKNKVKLAKDRINETVVRGGGITSKSLSEIPNNIKSMISKNYKKVAIMNPNKIYNLDADLGVDLGTMLIIEHKIPLNLSFKPTLLFVYIEAPEGDTDDNTAVILSSKHNASFTNITDAGKIELSSTYYSIRELKQDSFILRCGNKVSYVRRIKVTQIIAIE